MTEIISAKADNLSSSASLSCACFPAPPVACFRLEQTNLAKNCPVHALLLYQPTPSITATKCAVLINTNITRASPPCFGTCVSSSVPVLKRHLTLRSCHLSVLWSAAASWLTLIRFKSTSVQNILKRVVGLWLKTLCVCVCIYIYIYIYIYICVCADPSSRAV